VTTVLYRRTSPFDSISCVPNAAMSGVNLSLVASRSWYTTLRLRSVHFHNSHRFCRHRVSVRPSVRLSVTNRCSTKTAKPIGSRKQPTSYDSPGTLVFWYQRCRRNSDRVTLTGATNRGRVGADQRFSTNISLYLRNGAR